MTIPWEAKREGPSLARPQGLPEHTGVRYLFKGIHEVEAERFCATLWAMGAALA